MKRDNYENMYQGYVALMASIVISIVLLLFSVEGALIGWSTRFAVIANESKEQSIRAVHSCAELSMGKMLQNPLYRGNEVIEVSGGSCEIFPFVTFGVEEKTVTIKVRATIDRLVITHEYVYGIFDLHIEEPRTSSVIVNSNAIPVISLKSWREVYVGP